MNLIKPTKIRNNGYYLVGLLFLIINRIRHCIAGYRTPKTFSVTHVDRTIEYDFKVVNNWLDYYNSYTGCEKNFNKKSILELGVGDNLGIGLISLLYGASKYLALDKNNLIKNTPASFYDRLFELIESRHDAADVNRLREIWESYQNGSSQKIKYICDKLLDLSVFTDYNIDLVLSNAAFEHFEHFDETVKGLSHVVVPGCILVSEIDLKTHTRWIRDVDPNNIYRYSNFLYSMGRFNGIPNRLRPKDYIDIFNRYGWKNIKIYPKATLDFSYLNKIKKSLNVNYRNDSNEMQYLSIVICATKE